MSLNLFVSITDFCLFVTPLNRWAIFRLERTMTSLVKLKLTTILNNILTRLKSCSSCDDVHSVLQSTRGLLFSESYSSHTELFSFEDPQALLSLFHSDYFENFMTGFLNSLNGNISQLILVERNFHEFRQLFVTCGHSTDVFICFVRLIKKKWYFLNPFNVAVY